MRVEVAPQKADGLLVLEPKHKGVWSHQQILADPEVAAWRYLTVEYPKFILDKSAEQFRLVGLYRDALRKHNIQFVE